MSDKDFKTITNFEEIIEMAKCKINGKYELNFSLKVMFPIEMIRKPQLLDVIELAKNFQAVEKPETLYINHGKFIGEHGIDHIINELSNKNNGNRALMSLINQKNILDTGDRAIPSFMILQFSLEDGNLYVTTYFRALEVSKFLRINIEEIRMIIEQIQENIKTFNTIKLNIFAFRAYINENINTLIRPRIEMMESAEILAYMQSNPSLIIELLNEKISFSTVIENNSLGKIIKIVSRPDIYDKIHPCFNGPYICKILNDLITISSTLELLRTKTSHNKESDELNNQYINTMRKLIKELEHAYIG